MRRGAFQTIVCIVPLACLLAWTATPLAGQSGMTRGEWRTYGGDLGNTRYSSIDQINRDNFSKLEIAWRFKTDSLGPRREFNFQSTPLMVNGLLFNNTVTFEAQVRLRLAASVLAACVDALAHVAQELRVVIS